MKYGPCNMAHEIWPKIKQPMKYGYLKYGSCNTACSGQILFINLFSSILNTFVSLFILMLIIFLLKKTKEAPVAQLWELISDWQFISRTLTALGYTQQVKCLTHTHRYTHLHISFPPSLVELFSRSSQCSTTGVTKAVVCVILSVGWCI